MATLDKQTTWAPSTNFCHPEVRDSIVVVLSSVPFQIYLLQSPTFTTQYALSRQTSDQGEFDGRRQPTASPMLTAIMSGGVEISGRELYKYR